jgi:hypothetical protein
VRISNAGCWRWSGTASKTTQNIYGGTGRAVAMQTALERDPTRGVLAYQPVFTTATGGKVVVTADGPIYSLGCTLTILPTTGDIVPRDATLTLNFNGRPDPDDPNNGNSNNRTAAGGASTRLTVTKSIMCFGEPFGAVLNSDGRTISYTDPRTSPDGSVLTNTATLTAEREP